MERLSHPNNPVIRSNRNSPDIRNSLSSRPNPDIHSQANQGNRPLRLNPSLNRYRRHQSQAPRLPASVKQLSKIEKIS
jgi:hypothetical protein